MAQLNIKSSTHHYPIYIGEDLRLRLNDFIPTSYSSIMVITDQYVSQLYLQDVLNNFSSHQVYNVVIPSGEASKSIQMYYDLQTKAIENGLDRQSLIIALGGGVVGDLAGFVAATFMRGIDYIQIPTTILAHDSSVGGKVAINHELGKNLIGNFYPPQAVIYDVKTLHSLSEQEVRSGYAELIKEALIADHSFFYELLSTCIYSVSNKQLGDHLLSGIKIKASIVESDEKEAGIRKFLNLGHTLGHALEAELGYGHIAHGEAVAIGLLFALRLSENKYSIELPYDALHQWLTRNNYPLSLKDIDVQSIINHMKHDKKAINDKIQMILLSDVAKPTVTTISDEDLQFYLNKFLGELVEE